MAKDCELCNSDRKVRISFCPNCKSRNVRYVFELKNLFGVLPKMRCMECKTEMPSFPLLVINDKELKKVVKEKAIVKKKVVPKTKIKGNEKK